MARTASGDVGSSTTANSPAAPLWSRFHSSWSGFGKGRVQHLGDLGLIPKPRGHRQTTRDAAPDG